MISIYAERFSQWSGWEVISVLKRSVAQHQTVRQLHQMPELFHGIGLHPERHTLCDTELLMQVAK